MYCDILYTIQFQSITEIEIDSTTVVFYDQLEQRQHKLVKKGNNTGNVASNSPNFVILMKTDFNQTCPRMLIRLTE